jgi:hypothetical protein
MKRILFMAIFLPMVTFAQEETSKKVEAKKEVTVSLFLNASEPAQFGVSVEREWERSEKGFHVSSIYQISFGTMEVEAFRNFTGIGFVIDLGTRRYWKKESLNGFYYENFLSYGNIKFDEPMVTGVADQFIGTYSYLSLINPNLGYKINLGKFSLDPFVGFNWKWEFKGKGDFDNNITDNFVPRVGAKLGYRF